MDEPVRPDPAAASDAAGPSSGDPRSAPAVTSPDAGAATLATTPARPLLAHTLPPLTPRVLVVLIGAILVGIALYFGRHALGPFVVGLVLAYVLDVPVERISRIGLPRWLSVLLVYAVVVAVFVFLVALVVRPLANEISTFIREFPAFVASVTDQYAHLDLPPELREAIDNWLANLDSGVSEISPGDLLPVFTGIAGVLGAIVSYVIVPVWVFYLIKDRPTLTRAAERSLPEPWRPDARNAASLGMRVFGQWLRGQVFLGVVVGVATFIGLEILSMTVDPVFGRFAVLLSVIAGVLELLPIIGPIIAAIPAVILGLTAGVEAAIAAVILYTPVQQGENHVHVPKMHGEAVELHPSIVIAAIVLGGAIAGILGAIFAVPLTAAARDLFRYAYHRVDEPPATPDEAVAMIRAQPTIIPRDDGRSGPTDPADPASAGAGA